MIVPRDRCTPNTEGREPVKALITGAGGFVGPHLAAHLREVGDSVTPLDLRRGPDLRDGPGWIRAVADAGPDVVYHLAGLSDVGGSWADPVTTFEINALGTVIVLEAARLAGTARVVVVSSADVYGLVAPEDLPLTEAHTLRPNSPYGASKQAAEAAALQYHRGHGLDVVVVRPFNHLGPGQSTRFAAPAFADQIAAAEGSVAAGQGAGPLVLRHGDLTPERDLTDVRDVVRAYRLLAERGVPGEVYNVCSGRSVSMRQVLDTLLAASEAEVVTETDPALVRPVEVPVQQGSYAKLESATGWRPELAIDRTLGDVLDDARRRRGAGVRPGGRTIR